MSAKKPTTKSRSEPATTVVQPSETTRRVARTQRTNTPANGSEAMTPKRKKRFTL